MAELKRPRVGRPVAVLLLGVALVVVGLLITTTGLVPAGVSSFSGVATPPTRVGLASQPLGIALLAGGIGLGASVVGYLVGSRRRI